MRFFVIALLSAVSVFSQTTYVSDGSQADVQTKLTNATDGDTVTIPAGTFTWTSGVTITGKQVHLQGAGAGRVVARSASRVTVGTGTKAFTLTTENAVTGLSALRSAITAGATLKIWRTGGEITAFAPTGNLPWMRGTVTSLVGDTLTMDIATTNYSGEHGLWIVTTEATTNVVHNANNTPLIDLYHDTTGSVEISGIRFSHHADVTGTVNFIKVRDNAGEPSLIHDCYFENLKSSFCIRHDANKGVIWNVSFVNMPWDRYSVNGAIYRDCGGQDTSWTSTSTMGTADTTGKSNLYIEACDFHCQTDAIDFDSQSRTVVRYSLFNNSGVSAHGADTSSYGNRHCEIYQAEFVADYVASGEYVDLQFAVQMRGGTGVLTASVIPDVHPADSSDKSDIELCIYNLTRNAGPNALWGKDISGVQYHCPRQVGFGYVTGSGLDGAGRSVDSVTYVGDVEPVYIWNNTGAGTISVAGYAAPGAGEDSAADYIQLDRDYKTTAKPSWVAYEYPHPLRTETPATATARHTRAANSVLRRR